MRKLKLFFACLLMAVLSIGQVWGDEAPFAPSDFTGQGTSGTGSPISATKSTVTFACDLGYGGTQFRCYSGGKITISSANTITAISFTFSGSYTGGLNTSYTNLSTNNWEQTLGSQARITSCTVTYTAGGGNVDVTGVSLNKEEIELEVGATQTLVATITPGNATDQDLSWESDDANVASVDENGVVTAEGIGTATITVTTHDGDFTATCDVEVIAAQPKSILNFTAACSGAGTANDGVQWVVASDAAESTYDSNRGIHYGTGSKPVKYIELTSDAFTNKVKKVEVEAAGSNTPSLSVTVGGNAFGETATGITNSNVKYTFEPTSEQSSTDFTGAIVVRLEKASAANGALYIKSIVVTYEEAAETQVATPVIAGAEKFYPSTLVSITCGTDGAAIYYSIDGSAPSTLYSEPFEISANANVKAKATKAGLDDSEVVSKAFTKLTPLTTISNIFDAATDESAVQAITFNSAWVVTGVSTDGKNAYISDGTNGLILYNSSADSEHPVGGLEAGNTLSGTITCSLVKYNGAAEIENFAAAGLTKGTGTIGYSEVAISDLSGVNTGSLIQISGLCTKATVGTKDYYYIGGVQLYNKLFAFENPTPGSSYNCNGVYVYYKKGENDPINEICPRNAEDLAEQAAKQNANTQWVAASKTARIGDATTNWWSTSSDGEKSFSSTNESVAIIDAEGAITLVAPGTTTLKFSTAATDTYFAGPEVSMVLTVKAALPTGGAEFTWDATAQGYTNEQVLGEVCTTPVTITFAKADANNDPKYFTSDKTARVYTNGTLTISAPANKLLYEIVFDSNIDVSANTGTYESGSWSGVAKTVVFTPSATSKIKTINVVYADGTETSLSISDINLKTTDDETALSITKNVDATINYTGLNESVATIADNKVTPVAIGSTTVTASIAAGSNYTAASTTFTITVAAKTIPEMSFPLPSYNANLGSDFEEPTLTIAPDGLTVKYSSDNAAVSVDENTGEITLNTEGTAVITATSVETTDYAVNTASYTLNVTDPYKDVLTAVAIGKTSYETWNNKTFTTDTKYAGNNTTGAGTYANTLQMRVQNPSGIVNTSTIGYLKEISATATKNGDNTLDIYAKNTPYESSADLYDNDKRGTLIGTIAANGGEIDFEDGFAYSDNYKYIGIKAKGGAVYYDEIVIKWTPATINKYTVTYEAGEATGNPVEVTDIEEGTPITLATADTYSKDGYTFMGWNDGTQTYAAGASYTVNDDVTFTAQWAQNFTVTYKAGAATGDDVVRIVPAGAYNLESCSFAYANHAFDGWQNGSNKYNAGAAITISENMEFVATWVTALAPVTVTFNVNTLKSDKKALYKEGVNVSVTDGTFNNENNYRCYANKDMTISTELGNITNIVINSVTGNTAEAFSLVGDNGNYAYETLKGTWNGSSASIQLHASSQVRMTQIQVTYIPSAYLRNVTDANNFGTLCLPFNGTIEGAELLEFVDKDADNVYLGDADASVLAGKPYIFRSTAAQIKVSFTDNNFVAADNHNGLYGTYVRMENEELNGTCLISNNQYYNIDTDDCSLNAYRAYFMLSEVPSIGGNLARRRYAIGNGAPQVATGVDTLNASETPVKMIIDGQLYILRGEKMYDATGKLVK
jgi:uncharacterized protein YjdB